MLQEILQGEYQNNCYQYIWKVRARIAQESYYRPRTQKNWKAPIKNAFWKKADQLWEDRKDRSQRLLAHPKEKVKGAEEYVWKESKRSKAMTQWRLCDIGRKRRGVARVPCRRCNRVGIEWINLCTYIILECPGLVEFRAEGVIRQSMED